MNDDTIELREAVRRFGERLLRVFGEGTQDALAGAGIALPNEERFLLELDPPTKQSSSSAGPTLPTSEQDLFDGWCRAKQRSALLILGPFGAGKSGLLTQFALRCAEQLRDDTLPLEALIVPIPVRLRFWVEFAGNRQVGDDNANALWWDFLAAAQRIFPGEQEDDLLTVSQLRELHKRGLLAVFYDGFDELPGPHGSSRHVSRPWVASVINNLHRDTGLVLSSRPGYEAEHAIAGAQQYHIRELDGEEVDAISKQSLSAELLEKTKNLRKRLPLAIDRLLARPLFLAVWLMHVKRYGTVITDIGVLMHELVTNCFDQRLKEKSLTSEQIDDVVPQLGRVLSVFAHTRFDQPLGIEELRNGIASWGENAVDRAELLRLLKLGEALGFLMPIGSAHWHAAKVPVVEYLAGRFLAQLARGTQQEQQSFLFLFRRWIWETAAQESLELCFHLLADPKGARILAALVEWLCDVTLNDPYWTQARDPSHAKDNLLHPFIIRAAQITGQLQANGPAFHSSIKRVTDGVVACLSLPMPESVKCQIVDEIASVAAFRSTTSEFRECLLIALTAVSKNPSVSNQARLSGTINSALSRLRPDRGRFANLDHFEMARVIRTSHQEQDERYWRRGVKLLVDTGLSEERASDPRVVVTQMLEFAQGYSETMDARLEDALNHYLEAAVKRLDPQTACEFIKVILDMLDSASQDALHRTILTHTLMELADKLTDWRDQRYVLCVAARRVQEVGGDAADEMRDMLASVCYAISRTNPDRAGLVFRYLTWIITPRDHWQELALMGAIDACVSRLQARNAPMALGIVLDKFIGDGELSEDLENILKEIIARIPPKKIYQIWSALAGCGLDSFDLSRVFFGQTLNAVLLAADDNPKAARVYNIDSDRLVLDPQAVHVPVLIREIMLPFQLADAYGPDEQYSRLSAAMKKRAPSLSGYPDGRKPRDATNRNSWHVAFRELGRSRHYLSFDSNGNPVDEVEVPRNGTIQRFVRKAAFDQMLSDEALLDEFIRTRRNLKPKKSR